MATKLDKLVDDTSVLTDEQFKNRFSSITRLNEEDTIKIIKESGISNEDLANLVHEIKKSADFNIKSVQSITEIKGGVLAMAAIIKRLLF